MIRKRHGRKAAFRTISLSVSLLSLLFAVQGCSLTPTSTNSNTTAVAFRGNTTAGQTSSSRTLTDQTSTQRTIGFNSSGTKQNSNSSSNSRNSSNLGSGGLSSTFHANVSKGNARDVSTLEQFANGTVAKNLGYHLFSVVQTNSVLKIEFSSDTSQKARVLQDCYALSNDLTFSITLHQPLVGVKTVDIAASLHGNPILDYVTPANIMNEWGKNAVSAQYVKNHSQVKVK